MRPSAFVVALAIARRPPSSSANNSIATPAAGRPLAVSRTWVDRRPMATSFEHRLFAARDATVKASFGLRAARPTSATSTCTVAGPPAPLDR